MKIFCRGCYSMISDSVLISFNNMPKSAQFFPSKESLGEDSGVDIILRQCPYCGLVQAAGNPVIYYRDVIRATAISREMQEYRINQYSRWVDDYELKGKKVIEIGAGKGEYMQCMEATKAVVYGLEHLNESVETAVSSGHRMIKGFLEDESYEIENGPFDGFYTMNFLEHIPDPGAFVRAISNNLSTGGVGIVEVPNFDMMIEKSLYSEFIQDHLSYFTVDTLSGLLSRNGFEVLDIKPIWYNYIISAIVKKRINFSVDGMRSMQAKLKLLVHAYLKDMNDKGKKIAVWGAGHQALANISLLDISSFISCVIDSAEFKQGYYTPATHIRIVSPKALVEEEIGVVLIMAGSYSDEIADILGDYPNVDFAIMREDKLEMKNDFRRRHA